MPGTHEAMNAPLATRIASRPDRSRMPHPSSAPSGVRRRGRPSLVDEAYQQLRLRILNDELPPGAHALEQEIAAGLGISRTPVREALIRLEKEGLVEVLPRRGMRVLPLSPADMREIYELLYSLEPTAAERMAARHLPPDGPEITELEQSTADMTEALARDDLDGWAKADRRFHTALLHYCGNERLARTALGAWDQAHRARMFTLRLQPKPVDSAADHRAVADAIRRHNPDLAQERHRAHWLRAMRTTLDVIETYRLQRL
jgi:DNA-binding GntR family transcriptional regulator